MKKILYIVLAAGLIPLLQRPSNASAEDKEFNVIAVEYKTTKLWLPGTLIVKKGDRVNSKSVLETRL